MMEFVCWKWKPKPGYRSTFGPEAVNTLHRMIARNYAGDFRLTCITDNPAGIDSHIRIIELWDTFADVPSPHGGLNPSCYRRLKAFSEEAAEFIGPRFVSLDLDCVITGDIAPLVDRPEDFVIWGDTNPTTFYNGSFYLMRAGSRKQVWERFSPFRSPIIAKLANQHGSDQAWIGACLGPNEVKYGIADGVFSYRVHIVPNRGSLPKDARVVFFHGRFDPWDAEIQRIPWVQEHYR